MYLFWRKELNRSGFQANLKTYSSYVFEKSGFLEKTGLCIDTYPFCIDTYCCGFEKQNFHYSMYRHMRAMNRLIMPFCIDTWCFASIHNVQFLRNRTLKAGCIDSWGYVSTHAGFASIHKPMYRYILGWKTKISETSKIRIFRTVSPFWPPFEALGSYLDVFSYKKGFGISGRFNYVGSSKTYCFVNFYGVDGV